MQRWWLLWQCSFDREIHHDNSWRDGQHGDADGDHHNTGLGIRSFWKWAIALFLSEKWAIWKITHFSLTFEKSEKERSLIRSFAKSDKKRVRSFALFKRANERAIAQSHFWKERKWAMSDWAIAQPCIIVTKTLVFEVRQCSQPPERENPIFFL